jgi:hypothetical protein
MPAVASDLNLTAGGPSVMVPIDKEIVNALYKPAQCQVASDPAQHNRRSVYLIAKSNLRLPFLEVFDGPDTLVSCPRRESSTHAPHALELLNGSFSNSEGKVFARTLGGRIRRIVFRRQTDLAYGLAAGRAMGARVAVGPEFCGARSTHRAGDQKAWEEFALAMFNLNAFQYVN